MKFLFHLVKFQQLPIIIFKITLAFNNFPVDLTLINILSLKIFVSDKRFISLKYNFFTFKYSCEPTIIELSLAFISIT